MDSIAGGSWSVAMALSCQLAVRRIVDGSYSFVVPISCAGVSFTVAMALSYHRAVQAYR